MYLVKSIELDLKVQGDDEAAMDLNLRAVILCSKYGRK